MTDRARDAYLRDEIDLDEFERLVDLFIRERVPAPTDFGVLHGPIRRDDAFFGASVPLEYISDRLSEINQALNDDALSPHARWEWERLVREFEIRREALQRRALVASLRPAEHLR